MYRQYANGTVNAAVVGYGPPLFLFHSLLSDRASFDAIAPELSQSFRVIIPELPGFSRSQAMTGGIAGVMFFLLYLLTNTLAALPGRGRALAA